MNTNQNTHEHYANGDEYKHITVLFFGKNLNHPLSAQSPRSRLLYPIASAVSHSSPSESLLTWALVLFLSAVP